MALVLDTGVLYALADADDAWHERTRDLVARSREILLAPVTVLPEVTYLLASRLGSAAERAFVASLVAGQVTIERLDDRDVARAAALLERHPQIGFVDASVAAVAERLKLKSIATTDRRHFSAIRPRHRAAFELLP